MKRKLKFTIYHGFVASLALHSTLALPFALHALASPPEDLPPPLVIELQGVTADNQTEQKVLQETKGQATQEEAAEAKPAAPPTPPAPKPAEASAPPQEAPLQEQPTEVAENEKQTEPAPPKPKQTPPALETSPSPTATKAERAGGANNVAGTEVQQNAQTIKTDQQEIDRLREYVKLLTKKVQSNLIYPDEARQAGLTGTARVSFAILGTGQIRSETLKIVESSGQPKLDAGALKTIRASVPFNPPPREMTIAIAVAFGRKQ